MGQAQSRKHELTPKYNLTATKRDRQTYQSIIIELRDILKLFQVETETIGKIHQLACDQHKICTAEQRYFEEHLHQLFGDIELVE